MKNNVTFKIMGVFLFLVLILAVSIFFFTSKNMGHRRVLYFEAMDGSGLYMESRRIMEYSPLQEEAVHLQQFVQELLLGSVTNGFRSLFQQGDRKSVV